MMKYITVLDFTEGKVYQYDISEWDIENTSCEEFLSDMGHSISNIEWMVHAKGGIITS